MRSRLLFAFLGACVGCGGMNDEPVGEQAQACAAESEKIITRDHYIAVANGATLHVVDGWVQHWWVRQPGG